MSKKTLLLNSTYEVLSFVTERKMFKLLFKDKVEVVSSWEDRVDWINNSIAQPSIIRLKEHVKRNYFNNAFSRKALVKRDKSTCQFCGKKLAASQITVDHVLPRAKGGVTSFVNCVVSCQACNNKKADHTLEEIGFTLAKKPVHPSFSAYNYVADPQDHWHPDWDDFLMG